VPLITWEPYDRPLHAIAAGDYDSYIRESARAAAAWREPIFLRFAHEMNGDWYPWGLGVGGNTAADYKDAWRHVVRIFRQEGADNVRFVWSPNVNDTGDYPFKPLYPGDQVVDWVALDGYNFGAEYGDWESFTELFKGSYAAMNELTSKPLMIAETSSAEGGGDKAAWIRSALSCELPSRLPRVHALVWFDRDYEGRDWRIDSSSASLAAFRAAIASPTYGLDAASLLAGRWSDPRGEAQCPLDIRRALRVRGKKAVRVRVHCGGSTTGEFGGILEMERAHRTLAKSSVHVRPGRTKTVRVKLRYAGRRLVRNKLSEHGSMRVRATAHGSSESACGGTRHTHLRLRKA
jgi:hypothetical protein